MPQRPPIPPIAMIDLGTLAGLHQHRHQLAAYCPRCDRWAERDLGAMVTAGHGDRRRRVSVRCRACSEISRLQLRRPAPNRH